MNRKPAKSLALAVLFIFIAIAACSMPGNFFTSSQPEDSGDPGTLQALETQIAQLQNNSDEAQEVEQETDPEPEATEPSKQSSSCSASRNLALKIFDRAFTGNRKLFLTGSHSPSPPIPPAGTR